MKYEQLDKVEKTKWDVLQANLTKAQKVFMGLTESKRCIWCNARFPNRIIQNKSGTDRLFDAYDWFTPEYLVHTQTTHAFTPETITTFIETLNKK